MQEGEDIQMKLRKHWFVLLRDQGAAVIISGVIPFILILLIIISGAVSREVIVADTPITVYIIALWLVIVTMTAANLWTNYYLDLWIVTDRRIINVEQLRLFHRNVTTLPLDRIQDAVIETHGVIATLLDFGTIRIHSAGPAENDTIIEGIPHPGQVKAEILERALKKIGEEDERDGFKPPATDPKNARTHRVHGV